MTFRIDIADVFYGSYFTISRKELVVTIVRQQNLYHILVRHQNYTTLLFKAMNNLSHKSERRVSIV